MYINCVNNDNCFFFFIQFLIKCPDITCSMFKGGINMVNLGINGSIWLCFSSILLETFFRDEDQGSHRHYDGMGLII